MTVRITQVDAFTDRPFAGNPAAVCVPDAPREAAWMQSVALEMNLSETAFLVRRDDGAFDLRWFTPKVEVDLCGHATLASAHVLWHDGILASSEMARFQTRSGLITAVSGAGGWIEMDFPATPASAAEAPPGLVAALAVKPLRVAKTRFDYLVELESEAAVRAARPDFSALAKVAARGVIVTSVASTPGFDFVSRFFAPAAGIDEDPVTGSAHCCLAPYWGARLGKEAMSGLQVSARGGVVRVRTAGDRVLLGGQAVTVLRADLLEG